MSTRLAPPSGPAVAHPTLHAHDISRVPYLPALDGLRALAVVAVMIYHANHDWLQGGFLGVEVFFVISGYLITLLIVGEYEQSGRVSLRQFWLRRFRRLLPALFVMMLALAVYVALFERRAMGQVRGDFVGGLSYASNWYQIWVGQGYSDGTKFVPLRHLWSLAVEEQFYLVWPLVMIVVLRRGKDRVARAKAAGLFLATALIVALAMIALFRSGDVDVVAGAGCTGNGYRSVLGRCISVNDALYLSTVSRATGLLLGAAMAMIWRPLAIMRSPMRNRAGRLDVLAVASLVALAAMARWMYLSTDGRDFGQRFNPWLFRGGFLVVGVLSLLLIAAATHRRSILGRVLGMRPLRWVGTRSYGLYLYHWPIYQIIRGEAGAKLGVGQFALAMAITVVLTELSYRVVETPIRRGALGAWVRDRRSGVPRRGSAGRRRGVNVALPLGALVSFSVVSIALADNVCVGQQQCAEQQATGLVAPVPVEPAPPASSTTAPTVAVPATDEAGNTIAPPETVPQAVDTTVPTATAPPVSALPPLALGESVMAGAVGQLTAGGFAVDAAVGRQGSTMADLVSFYAASGQIGDLVVIQIGTNGSVSDETLARIMAPLVDVPLVVFLTVRAPRGWIADNNIRITRLPETYPNVRIADWATASQTVQLCDDGYHVSCNGAAVPYANVIFEAIGRPDLKR